jgi:hypothetical protein
MGLTVAFCLLLFVQLSGCGGGSGGGGGTGDEETFTNGGVTLTTSISDSTSTSKTVTVTDADGDTALTLVVTQTGLTMSAPGQTDASMTFRQTQDTLVTDYTARRMAMFAAGGLASSSVSAMPDAPGCDWFPDTQCTLGCCADHDQCYSANSCGASSWLWGFGSDACDNCNDIVYDCIAAACAGVTESFTENNCYDGSCDKHYDCPPDYTSCTCTDICADEGITVPADCGDGVCGTGESLENCFTDCGFGNSASSCCAAHSCPDETGSSCGSCGVTCCCAQDYACDWHVGASPVRDICVPSAD